MILNRGEISNHYNLHSNLNTQYTYCFELSEIMEGMNENIIEIIADYTAPEFNDSIMSNTGEIISAVTGEKIMEGRNIRTCLLYHGDRIIETNRSKVSVVALNQSNYASPAVTPRHSPRRSSNITPPMLTPRISPSNSPGTIPVSFYTASTAAAASRVTTPPILLRSKSNSMSTLSPSLYNSLVLSSSGSVGGNYTEGRNLLHHTNSVCKHETGLKIKCTAILPDDYIITACMCKMTVWDIRAGSFGMETAAASSTLSPQLSISTVSSSGNSGSNSMNNSPIKLRKTPSSASLDHSKTPISAPSLTTSSQLSSSNSCASTGSTSSNKPNKLFSLHWPDQFLPKNSSLFPVNPTPRLFLCPLSHSKLAVLCTQFYCSDALFNSNPLSSLGKSVTHPVKFHIAAIVLDFNGKEPKNQWKNAFIGADNIFPTSLIRLSGGNGSEQLISEFSDGTIKKWLISGANLTELTGYSNLYDQDADCLYHHAVHCTLDNTAANLPRYLPSLDAHSVNSTWFSLNNKLQMCVHSSKDGRKLYNLQLKLQWNREFNNYMSPELAETTPLTAAGLQHIIIGPEAVEQKRFGSENGLPVLNKTLNCSSAVLVGNGTLATLDASLSVVFIWNISGPERAACVNIIALGNSRARYLASNIDNLGRNYDWSEHNLNAKLMAAIEEIDSPSFHLPEPVNYPGRSVTQSILHTNYQSSSTPATYNIRFASGGGVVRSLSSQTTPNSRCGTPTNLDKYTQGTTTALFDLYHFTPPAALMRLTSLTLTPSTTANEMPARSNSSTTRALMSNLTNYPSDYGHTGNQGGANNSHASAFNSMSALHHHSSNNSVSFPIHPVAQRVHSANSSIPLNHRTLSQ
jgi:hypothetical protein